MERFVPGGAERVDRAPELRPPHQDVVRVEARDREQRDAGPGEHGRELGEQADQLIEEGVEPTDARVQAVLDLAKETPRLLTTEEVVAAASS